MSSNTPVVYVVDNDPEFRESIALMVRGMGFNVESYASAEAFIDNYQDASEIPKCMVLDVRMPGLSGLGLQQMLSVEGKHIPIIMVSGCADIPMVVKAMSTGALDFLEKPVSSRTLSVRIREAIDRSVRQQRDNNRKSDLTKQLERLSARQREVLDLLILGERSKQIARQLGIGEKTVAKHRAAVLEKLKADSVVELVRLFAEADLATAPTESGTMLRCDAAIGSPNIPHIHLGAKTNNENTQTALPTVDLDWNSSQSHSGITC